MSRRFLGSLVVSWLLAARGCGGNAATSPSAPPTPPPYPYAGTWRGSTPNGSTVSFTVTENQVTTLTLENSELIFIPPGTFSSCAADLRLAAPATISGNAFAAQVQNTFGATTVRGTFSSSSAASGTFDAWRNTSGTCGNGTVVAGDNAAGTWQATR